MATRLTINIASLEEFHESPKTDAETADIIRWFLHDHPVRPPAGLTTAQENRWWLREYLKELMRYTRQRAAVNLRRIREVDESIQAQIEIDTAI